MWDRGTIGTSVFVVTVVVKVSPFHYAVWKAPASGYFVSLPPILPGESLAHGVVIALVPV